MLRAFRLRTFPVSLFSRLQNSWKLRKLKSREIFFYDVAEISTIRPLQRRPLRKVPNTCYENEFQKAATKNYTL